MSVFPKQVDAAEEQVVEQSKRIEFFLTEYSVELLAAKMQNGDFEIPPYQRGRHGNQSGNRGWSNRC